MTVDVAVFIMGIASILLARPAGNLLVKFLEWIDKVGDNYDDRRLEGRRIIVDKEFKKLLR